jgi:undecaprenyl-diphosphatase
MSMLQAVLLALVQGITEFLPISSSAHLALAPWLLGWRDQGLTFDIALHFGTLAAVLLYFYQDWMQVIAQGFGLRPAGDPELAKNRWLLWLMAAASLPIGFFGFLFQEAAETSWRSPLLIGGMLIGVGLLMAYAEKVGRRVRDIGTVSFFDAMVIGCAQAVAIVPGTSRSGITITAGLFLGFERAAAARFSFLLSTPAIGAAAAKAFWDLYQAGGVPPDMRVSFVTGIVVSALSGCAVIAFFLRFLRQHSLRFFIHYRIIFGIIIIALAFLRRNGG